MLVGSVLLVALVGFSIGAGTVAYFSDVEKSIGNQIKGGVLDIQIKDSDEDWTDGAVHASMSSPPLKPGQEFWTDKIKLKNVGNIDAQYVYISFRNLQCYDGDHPESEWDGDINYIAKQIVLVEIEEYSPNMNGVGRTETTTFDETTANAWLKYWGAPEDGSISLWDIIHYGEPRGGSAKTSFRLHTGDPACAGSGGQPCHMVYPYLPVGKTVWVRFKWKLLENTNNVAQGDIAQFDVWFIATNALNGDDVDSSF